MTLLRAISREQFIIGVGTVAAVHKSIWPFRLNNRNCFSRELLWRVGCVRVVYCDRTDRAAPADEIKRRCAAVDGHQNHKYHFLFHFMLFNITLTASRVHKVRCRRSERCGRCDSYRFSVESGSFSLNVQLDKLCANKSSAAKKKKRRTEQNRRRQKNYDVLYVYHFAWHFYDFILFLRLIFMALPFFLFRSFHSLLVLIHYLQIVLQRLSPSDQFWMDFDAWMCEIYDEIIALGARVIQVKIEIRSHPIWWKW